MRRMKTVAFVSFSLLAATASADAFWPPVVLAYGVSSWPIVATGLLVELPFVLWAYRLSLKRAAVATAAMNAASFLVGIPVWRWLFSPLSLWSAEAHFTLPFSIAQMSLVWLGSILLSTVVELGVLRLLFRLSVSWRWSRWIFLANIVSTTLGLLLVLALFPLRA